MTKVITYTLSPWNGSGYELRRQESDNETTIGTFTDQDVAKNIMSQAVAADRREMDLSHIERFLSFADETFTATITEYSRAGQ